MPKGSSSALTFHAARQASERSADMSMSSAARSAHGHLDEHTTTREDDSAVYVPTSACILQAYPVLSLWTPHARGPPPGGSRPLPSERLGPKHSHKLFSPSAMVKPLRLARERLLKSRRWCRNLTIPQRAGHGHLREWHHHPIEQLAPVHPRLRSCHIPCRAFALGIGGCEGAVGEPCLDRCSSPV